MSSRFCPVTQSLNDYLDWEDRPEPETVRCRCVDCGRFFSREVDLLIPPQRCEEHQRKYWLREHYPALVARSETLQRMEGYKATAEALGSLAPKEAA